MKHSKGWFVIKGIGGIVFTGLLTLGFAAQVMVLWNWVMPDIFGVGQVTYWQAFGLLLLAHLFKLTPGPSRRWFSQHGGGTGGEGKHGEAMRSWHERRDHATGGKPAAPQGSDAVPGEEIRQA